MMNDTVQLTLPPTEHSPRCRSFLGAPWPPLREFWQRDFPEATMGGVAPFLFKDLLPSTFPTHEEVPRALRVMQQRIRGQESTPARLRVYLDEERFDDLVGKVLGADFAVTEPLSAFVQRVTGSERFCLVINNLEVLSEPLAAALGDFLHSMFAVRGIPIGGCEQVAFVGNYEGTPFGVHEGFEHAFLVHLGPGVKDFYCWSQADYLRLTGRRAPTFGDYEWLLGEGQKFVMEPGDVLYLPAEVFHVGRLTDLAVSIAVPLYTYPRERVFLRAILPTVADALLSEVEAGPSPHEPLSYDASPLGASFAPLADTLLPGLSDHCRAQLSSVLAYRWYRLLSNGGWEISQSHLLLPGTDEDLAPPLEINPRSTLCLQPPYKLCWAALDCPPEHVRVFLRGRSVTIAHHDALPRLFVRLNDGEQVSLDGAEALLTAFRTISRTGGLTLVR